MAIEWNEYCERMSGKSRQQNYVRICMHQDKSMRSIFHTSKRKWTYPSNSISNNGFLHTSQQNMVSFWHWEEEVLAWAISFQKHSLLLGGCHKAEKCFWEQTSNRMLKLVLLGHHKRSGLIFKNDTTLKLNIVEQS